MTCARDQAAQVVADMAALGAEFDVIDQERWLWRPRPESHREPIRRFLRSVDPRPSGRVMVGAIRKLQGGAHTVNSASEIQELQAELVEQACRGAVMQLEWSCRFVAGGHLPQALASFERAVSFVRSAGATLREIEAAKLDVTPPISVQPEPKLGETA